MRVNNCFRSIDMRDSNSASTVRHDTKSASSKLRRLPNPDSTHSASSSLSSGCSATTAVSRGGRFEPVPRSAANTRAMPSVTSSSASSPVERRRCSSRTMSSLPWASRRTNDTASSAACSSVRSARTSGNVRAEKSLAPPETGGKIATSSDSLTTASGVHSSPLSHTVQDSNTLANDGPNCCLALDKTSATVAPAMVSRGVPAASRADAKSRSRATWSAYPSDYPATGTSESLYHASNEPQPVNTAA